jgi:hypothetical protein
MPTRLTGRLLGHFSLLTLRHSSSAGAAAREHQTNSKLKSIVGTIRMFMAATLAAWRLDGDRAWGFRDVGHGCSFVQVFVA